MVMALKFDFIFSLKEVASGRALPIQKDKGREIWKICFQLRHGINFLPLVRLKSCYCIYLANYD